jgi:hypothetical protein
MAAAGDNLHDNGIIEASTPPLKLFKTRPSHFYVYTSIINMSKTVEISAAFSTISSRLDSFGCWPYQCWPPKQLAAHGFYKMPGKDTEAGN